MKINNIFLSVIFAFSLSIPAFAEPSYSVNSWAIEFKEAVNSDMIEKATKEMATKKVLAEKTEFKLSKIKDADLKAFAKAFPQATEVSISNSEEITNIAPIANLKNLKEVYINLEHIADMSALAGLTALEKIKVHYKGEGQDLKWMSKLINLNKIDIRAKNLASIEGLPTATAAKEVIIAYAIIPSLEPLVKAMPNIEDLNVNYSKISDLTPIKGLANLEEFNAYGATIKDFSPLAENPKLELVYYYAVKEADFSSLGKLKQIKDLNGGLTSLATIDWLQDMPKLKSMSFFSEYVTDYSFLKNAPNLEELHLWSMRKPLGDLAFLSNLKNLKELRIESMDGVTNFEAIANLQKLEELTLRENNEDEKTSISLGFLAKLTNIESIYISEQYVESIDVRGLASLDDLDLSKVNIGENQKPLDLSNVKDLPELRSLKLSEINVVNFNAVSNMPELTSINIAKANGITDLSNLAKLPKLKSLTVTKGAFTDAQLSVLPKNVKIYQR